MRKGFTLTELIIVVAIIGITAGIVNDTDIFMAQKAKSESSARQVYNVLREARSIAIIERKTINVDIAGQSIQIDSQNTLSEASFSTVQGKRLSQKLNNKIGATALQVTPEADKSYTFTPRGLLTPHNNIMLKFKETRDEALSYEYVEVAFTGLIKYCRGADGLPSCEDQ